MDINNGNLVEAFRKSGKTQIEFCSEHNIELEKLRYYLYKKGKQSVKRSQKKRTVQLKPASFISFKAPVPAEASEKLNATIIYGKFSIAEISKLIRSLGGC